MNLVKTHKQSDHFYLCSYSKEEGMWEYEGLYAK